MKSETKPNKTDAKLHQSPTEGKRLMKSAQKPAISDQTMTRLERIRLVVLVLILGGLALYAWRHHQWTTQVREVDKLLGNEDAVTAIEKIRSIERSWGRSGETSFFKARAHRYLDQIELCERFLSESRVGGYSPERLDHEKQLLEVQCSDFEISEQSARRIISSYQADIDENGTALIRGLLRTNDSEGAYLILAVWNNAQKDTDLNSGRLNYVTGLVAEQIGQFDKAKEEFQKAYELLPDYIPLWFKLANTYWRDNDAEKAYALFEQYFQKRPDDPAAEGGRIESMLALGHYEQVADYFKSYTMPLDTSGRGRLFLAQAYEGLEKHPEVITTLEPLVKDWPQDIVANQLLAVAYQAVGRAEEATKCAEQARLSVGEQTKIPELRRQLAENFRSADLHQQLGTLLLKLVSRNEGVSELKIALSLDPNNKPAHEALANFYDVMGNPELAAEHRKAIESKQ